MLLVTGTKAYKPVICIAVRKDTKQRRRGSRNDILKPGRPQMCVCVLEPSPPPKHTHTRRKSVSEYIAVTYNYSMIMRLCRMNQTVTVEHTKCSAAYGAFLITC